MTVNDSLMDRVDWDKQDGLVPAVVRDADNGRVLMLGYMNREALAVTVDTGRVTFFSRSRECLWTKGETSGNTLDARGIHLDCDRDTLLVDALPAGPTCHLGTASCFDGADAEHPPFGFLGHLEQVIAERLTAPPADSYTARLAAEGVHRLAQKVGEEGVELALAATTGDPEQLVSEAADLVFHLLVLLRAEGQSLGAVTAELAARHRTREPAANRTQD